MERGKLYGVGVGPGDPELLTRKAIRIIREADVVALPDRGGGGQTARAIVQDYLDGKELLSCPTPMVRDQQQLEVSYQENADRICTLLEAGKTVVFLTLGDPTIYSTYIYIHERVLERGFQTELVPGVPSFCAAAARLGVSLCQREERLLIAPASHSVEDCAGLDANQIYMKAGRNMGELQRVLERHGSLGRAMAVSNCGMEDERVWPHAAEIPPESRYFTVVFVPQKETEE